MPCDAISVDISGCEQRLERDLRALALEAGARGGALTVADVARLYSRREDVGRAYRGEEADADAPGNQIGLIDREVRIRGTTIALRSKNIGAEILLAQAQEWLNKGQCSELFHLYYVAYILANAGDGDALRRVAVLSQSAAIVQDWAIGLTCQPADIQAALAELAAGAYPPSEVDEEPEKKTPESIMPPSSASSPPSLAAVPSIGSTP